MSLLAGTSLGCQLLGGITDRDLGGDAGASGDADSGEAGVACSVAGQPYRDAVLTDLPLAYWPLDEPSVVPENLGSAGHDAVLTGSVTWIDGAAGSARAIALEPGFLDAGTHESYDFANRSFTLEAWIRALEPETTGLSYVVSRQTGAASVTTRTGFDLILSYGELGFGDERLMFELWTKPLDSDPDAGTPDSYYFGNKSPHPTPGVWTHVVSVRRGSLTEVWIDGVLVSKGIAVGSITTDARLVWGAESESLGATYAGALDEPAIYDRDLPAESIRAHWCAGQ